MIRPIVKIEFLMKRPSAVATIDDVAVAQDLLDTLAAHAEECVGMAGNMIGVLKRVIAFTDFGTAESYTDAQGETPNRVMFNPELVSGEDPYITAEGCLSLKGMRNTRRFRKITVRYQDELMAWHEETFENFTAQIIQHQIDHCNGKVI